MVAFPTIQAQNILETMARFVKEKNFETVVAFPTIPVQKMVETMARVVKGKKV